MIAGNHKVIEALLGSVNVSFLSLSDLTNDDVKRAGIKGKMLNISHESGKDVNANVLKQLTSGERVLIKHLNVDPRETAGYGKFIADCDAVEEWTEIIGKMADLANFAVSDFCRRHAPKDQPKFDIADYLRVRHFTPF